MTLVLTLITTNFACQVSDRRLSDGYTGSPLDTKASKTVMFPAISMLGSYTGLASVSREQSMDEWLLRSMWDLRQSNDFFSEFAERATALFKSVRLHPVLKRHAFLFTGWLDREQFEGVEAPPNYSFSSRARIPFITAVSNFHDFSDGAQLPVSSDRFTHRSRPLYDGEKFWLARIGAQLLPHEHTELVAAVSTALRSGQRERAAAIAMLRTLRKVSERDSSVGGGAFVASIPIRQDQRSQQRSRMTVLGAKWGLPELGTTTFLHIPNDDSEEIESPGIILFPFAGWGSIRVSKDIRPTIRGVGPAPEEAEFRMRLIALTDSATLAGD